MNLEKAEGSTTRFGWLPEVWQRYPEHQVLVLTDGAGSLPAYIPDSCRARTSALLIGLENYSDEQREEILAVAEAIAGKVVEVRSLDDLAGILGYPDPAPASCMMTKREAKSLPFFVN